MKGNMDLFEAEYRARDVIRDRRGKVVGIIWRAMLRPFTKQAHSHKRENERRVKQIAKGMLKVSKE